MIFNHRQSNICSLILVLIFISSATAIPTPFCNNLTSTDDQNTPCFLESPTYNPALIRSSGNSLVLPCHVARSKHSSIEWWYQDFQKLVHIRVYPVMAPIRPTVLRFMTSASVTSRNTNETDIIDVSVLLRNVNVDDSGIYQCVIRPWTPSLVNYDEDNFSEGPSDLPALSYHVNLTGSRFCQASLGSLPCFSNMRTSSPTFIDAYQTAFLQCVVNNHNRPVTVFWVVGNASVNSVLITDYLATNRHNGDGLRRVFPHSPFDFSIELTINRDTPERTYSCVIDGVTDVETTLFTYVVRSIDLQSTADKTIKQHKNHTVIAHGTEAKKPPVKTEVEKSSVEIEAEKSSGETEVEKSSVKIVAHDALTPEQIDELKHKKSNEHHKIEVDKSKKKDADDDGDLLELFAREETSTTR